MSLTKSKAPLLGLIEGKNEDGKSTLSIESLYRKETDNGWTILGLTKGVQKTKKGDIGELGGQRHDRHRTRLPEPQQVVRDEDDERPGGTSTPIRDEAGVRVLGAKKVPLCHGQGEGMGLLSPTIRYTNY